jgi:hypothetical protein
VVDKSVQGLKWTRSISCLSCAEEPARPQQEPVWATDPSSLLITEEEYEALPAEICKSIEVVNGRVIFCESPSPSHQRVSRNLTMTFLAARPASP